MQHLFHFFDGKNWQSLTNKSTGELLAPNTLKSIFRGINLMRNVLNLDETPLAIEWSFQVTTKLKRELPANIVMESILLMELYI